QLRLPRDRRGFPHRRRRRSGAALQGDMGRLGLVALERRSWRPYLAPVAFLAAVTLAVGLIRSSLRDGHSAPARPVSRPHKVAPKPKGPAVYVVRAGDTINGIADRTHLPAARLLALNPGISPTALFIGQKLKLR